MSHNVAIVGATGAVGEELLAILAQRDFPLKELRAFASERSVGKSVRFRDQDIRCEALKEEAFDDIDIALFSAGGSTSKEWAPKAAARGCIVIDNSSAFRMDDSVPLVVPEVNPEALTTHKGIIANPNCTTIILLVGIAPLHRKYGIRRAVISTYQAASGAGRRAMMELEEQSRKLLAGESVEPEIFPATIGFNLIPHCDVFEENGFTREESKVLRESRKILSEPGLKFTTTAVRVPVLRAHAESVNLELATAFDLEELRAELEKAPGLKIVDTRSAGGYPMPQDASGRDAVLVGRIRRDDTVKNGLSLFLCGDQIRKGAALNAIQIAELLGAG